MFPNTDLQKHIVTAQIQNSNINNKQKHETANLTFSNLTLVTYSVFEHQSSNIHKKQFQNSIIKQFNVRYNMFHKNIFKTYGFHYLPSKMCLKHTFSDKSTGKPK